MGQSVVDSDFLPKTQQSVYFDTGAVYRPAGRS